MIIKKDWRDGQYFNYLEFNRLLDNCKEISLKWNFDAPNITYKNVTDIVSLTDINRLVSWIKNAPMFVWGADTPSGYYIPSLKTYYQSCWTAFEINGIEADLEMLDSAGVDGVTRITEEGAVRVTEEGYIRILE